MWSLVEHQLENARALANSDEKRPRAASLRRAVSTSYYALFQALCDVSADRLVGRSQPWEVFTPVFRSLEHRHVASALTQSPLTGNREIREIGIAFVELQKAREWADYNPEPYPNYDKANDRAPFRRREALKLIQIAQDAVERLYRLDDDDRLMLAVRLVARSRR